MNTCPLCSGKVTYQGLTAIECGTPGCENGPASDGWTALATNISIDRWTSQVYRHRAGAFIHEWTSGVEKLYRYGYAPGPLDQMVRIEHEAPSLEEAKRLALRGPE